MVNRGDPSDQPSHSVKARNGTEIRPAFTRCRHRNRCHFFQ